MYSVFSSSFLFYITRYVVPLAALPLLFSRTGRPRLEKALFVFAAFILVAHAIWLLSRNYGFLSWDFGRMYGAGENALNGISPYEVPNFVYLPTSLPFFELCALVPFGTMQQILLVGNTLMVLSLPYVSWIVLKESGPYSEERTGSYPYAASACILAAPLVAIEAGQMQVITCLLILFALHLKFRGRPFLAGLSLAAATLKITMMLPALTQFCDKKGRWAWVGLVTGVAMLLALGTSPHQIPDRIGENLANIAETSRPGGHDDIAFENSISEYLVSIERLLYCLGMRDRPAIKLVELGILGLMAVALAWASATRRLAPDASLAAACTFGTFFLYHRFDTVLLAPALFYCTAGARREVGWSRMLFNVTTVAILAVMSIRGPWFRSLALWSLDTGTTGRIVQIFVVPYAIWFTIGVMAVLCLVPRSNGQPAS
jgi:hypothetical protein